MEYLLICVVALLGSGLTFFSGFGLGTLLLPVFALFFPVEEAIILTAIVHFLNNLFKLFLTGRHIDRRVLFYFGIPAILAAFGGALLLKHLSDARPVLDYTVAGHAFEIYLLPLCIGILLIVFAIFELIPRLSNFTVHAKYLPAGGILSGFFGGLSGHQGALRSMFLLRAGLSKESFIATGVAIACLIDVSRLVVYIPQILLHHQRLDYTLLTSATFSAFAGAFLGAKLLRKITVQLLQYLVATFLIVFGLLLAAGIVHT